MGGSKKKRGGRGGKMNKQEKSPEKELNEIEASNLPDI